VSTELTTGWPNLCDKTIAVVGNAASILDYEDGEWIDSHEIVIRFNCNWPTFHQREMGTKTQVMAGALQGFRNGHKKDSWMNMLGVIGISRQPTDMVGFHFPQNWNRDLARKMGAEPTTGVLILHWLTEWYAPASINCFGFDFLRTKPIYREGKIHTSRHCAEAERQAAINFQRVGVEYPRMNLPNV